MAGEIDGEAGGGGDGGGDGDAGGEGFLHDFERGASADEEDVVGERKFLIQESPAEDFIDGVMAADIFAHNEEVSAEVEEGGGVEAAGFFEGGLCGADFAGEGADDFGREWRRVGDGREILVNGFDGGFAAEAAARTGEDVAGELVEVDLDGWSDEDVEDVAELGVFAGFAGSDFGDVRGVMEQAFGVKEAASEFGIVTGRAHGDGDALAANANFEGLFAGEPVRVTDGRFVTGMADNPGGDDGVVGMQGYLLIPEAVTKPNPWPAHKDSLGRPSALC